ncbi:hypothetical protein G6F57_018884 [Rhizopus arrhizus]|nr:hypothetical protein G6F57_018884 [Rhizopus arrhizus]
MRYKNRQQVLRAYPEQGFVVPAVGLRRAAIGAPSDRGFASPTAHGNAGADACPGDAAEVLAGLPGVGGNFYPARVIKRERGDSACRVADFHLRQPAPVTVAFAHRVGPHASGSAQTEVFGRIQVVVGPLAAETAKQAPARRHGLQARNVKIQLAVVPRRVRAQAVGGGQIAVQLQGARRPAQGAIRQSAATQAVAHIELRRDRHAVAELALLDLGGAIIVAQLLVQEIDADGQVAALRTD